jgi:hypothetical protein
LAQVKIVASKDIVEKFKKIVLAKHGKLELSAEGEEALRLYMNKGAFGADLLGWSRYAD